MPGCSGNGNGSARFPTTVWSMVARAANPQSESSREALASLCAAYWYPVYGFIRRKGVDAEEARDLTQEFFTLVIEKKCLASVDPSKGRFRSFLLACVSHFLSNRRDAERAWKRGGQHKTVRLLPEDAERMFRREMASFSTPEALFEYHWALTILDRSLKRLRLAYGGAAFERLKAFLAGTENRGQLAAEAQQMGVSAGSLRVSIHRFRLRYREALRAEIGRTLADSGDIEAELRYLLAVVARGAGEGRWDQI